MNGAIFDLRKGCYNREDDEYIFPAQKINCKCDFKPIIMEFTDDLRKINEKESYFRNVAKGNNY